MTEHKICVLGSGAWGTAIADMLARKGCEVKIYGVCENEIDEINNFGTNARYFGEKFKIASGVEASLNLDYCIKNANAAVFAVPSFAIKETAEKIADKISEKTIIVNVAKGFDGETKEPLSRIIKESLPKNYRGNVVSLLGPSFAEEVAERQYTAITVSGEDESVLKRVQKLFSCGYFRVYVNSDYIGTEYCAALKNVIALACGMADGLGLKNNSRAALITRGLAEIVRFVKFFGGNEKTCYGLAGVGDLMLTCSSTTSRNYTAGYKISSTSAEQFFKENTKTVEGVFACTIAYEIAKENNIYSPIISSVHSVLFENANPRDEIEKLMNGDLKSE